MSRPIWVSAAGTTVFVFAGPGSVVGLVPWVLVRWFAELDLPAAARWLGLLAIVPGAVLLLDSWVRFVVRGRGTPAPIAPPTTMVASGFYRFVRNPMYVGIVLVLLGESLLFASPAIFAWAAVMWTAFHLFVVFYEEPGLRRRFGPSYDEYLRSVPRWIPRVRA